MRKLIVALGMATAVCLASAAVAFADGGPPVQSATQSAGTSQQAGAVSSAQQVNPTNTNISIRILSPGDDGNVTQTNTADSTANAGNAATTSQSVDQSQPGGGVQSSQQAVLAQQLALAESATKQSWAQNLNTPVRIGSPGNGGNVTQSNDAGSAANAGNAASTDQGSQQSQGSSCGCGGSGGVQSATQSAGTSQAAGAASQATQVNPSNTNISIRILSPGNDGNVTQSNSVTSNANAGNTASTEQQVSQGQAGGSSCGCAAAPVATESQQPAADPSATQATSSDPQAGSAAAPASSPAPSVQASGQEAATDQTAIAGSSAEQDGASNANYPVRIDSPGDNGNVSQSNAATSQANAGNAASTTQSSDQSNGGSSCGCGGIGVQAAGQKAETTQGALALSKAIQLNGGTPRCGCGGESRCGCGSSGGSGGGNITSPVRVSSPGTDGNVTQSNTADSSANAGNRAGTKQDASQTTGGGGLQVQALGQEAATDQAALAGSLAAQLGASNEASPVRVWSPGGGGSVDQSNSVGSSARSGNDAWTSQTGAQTVDGGGCECWILPIQAIGQRADLDQLGLALSGAFQFQPNNDSSPYRVGSDGGGGSVEQANTGGSRSDSGNRGGTDQSASQLT